MPTLNWIGKDKVQNYHAEVPFRALQKKYSSPADSNSENKIIHGDNLEALKSLLPEYESQIKCIYIDPPYNTGNENWVYNDNVNSPEMKQWLGKVVGKQAEDLTRHDKWLCMMYPRLMLLKKLLKPDGVIFISIDDNEQANLKLICDEIFGANNFVTQLIWNKKNVVQNDAKFVSTNHEYVICYRKSDNMERFNLLERTETADARYENPDNDPHGKWTSVALQAKSGSKANLYEIEFPNGVFWKPVEGTFPRLNKESLMTAYNENRLWFGKNGKNVPRLKKYLSEVKQGMVANTILPSEQVGSTQMAKEIIKKIFENNIFDTPKPPKLIERILQLSTDPDSIILDSFAGSGTTAHAVLNLNAQDSGNRKFILIECEPYAESITAERVRRVIKSLAEQNQLAVVPNFSFYELGEAILINEELNPNASLSDIRQYIWYTETGDSGCQSSARCQPSFSDVGNRAVNHNQDHYRQGFQPLPTEKSNPHFLGKNMETDYYFYYEKDKSTYLDYDFLATITEKSENYVIYADVCYLSADFLAKHRIRFKKIPRDISKI